MQSEVKRVGLISPWVRDWGVNPASKAEACWGNSGPGAGTKGIACTTHLRRPSFHGRPNDAQLAGIHCPGCSMCLRAATHCTCTHLIRRAIPRTFACGFCPSLWAVSTLRSHQSLSSHPKLTWIVLIARAMYVIQGASAASSSALQRTSQVIVAKVPYLDEWTAECNMKGALLALQSAIRAASKSQPSDGASY